MKPAAKFGAVLGQVVVRKRKQLDLTQGQAAKKMELPQSSLSRLERGSANFTVTQLRRAAGALKTEVSQMILEAEAGEIVLVKNGVKILDEEPPEKERHRWVWVAPKEIEQTVATIKVRLPSDYVYWKSKTDEKEKVKTYVRRP
jgi:transcriptional regulator with XRE-family HTH domain